MLVGCPRLAFMYARKVQRSCSSCRMVRIRLMKINGIHLHQSNAKPRLLRAFVDFNGDRSKRRHWRTPLAWVNQWALIMFDLKAGNLLCVWRSVCWCNAHVAWSGDGSFRPMGAAEFTFRGQPLAFWKVKRMPFRWIQWKWFSHERLRN